MKLFLALLFVPTLALAQPASIAVGEKYFSPEQQLAQSWQNFTRGMDAPTRRRWTRIQSNWRVFMRENCQAAAYLVASSPDSRIDQIRTCESKDTRARARWLDDHCQSCTK